MTAPSLTLYDCELDEDCYRARLALALLGLSYMRVAVDMFPGGAHLLPPVSDMSPDGRMPVLVIENEGINAVHVGAAAVSAVFAMVGPDWLGEGTPAMRDVRDYWLAFWGADLSVTHAARLGALFDQPCDAAALSGLARKALRQMEDAMTHRQFEGRDWFLGDAPSIVDVLLFPAFALSRDYGLDHGGFPALRRWGRRVRALPGFITMPGIPDYA